ncbi:MAG: hypothetical protein PF439_02600 [Helicobacteraceae bacterium]|nr:hypothetical protein [Helicobacteraceae bacterium]
MLGLFILFLFFIFGGYHQSKLEEREGKIDHNKKDKETDNIKE